MSKQLNRLIVKGGVLSPGELKYICESVESLGLKSISFGSRQDILFSKEIDAKRLEEFDKLKIIQPKSNHGENIISSYLSTDIFPTTSWLTSGRYLYVLEQFRQQPKLKVNITDPKQRLVPLFTGHLNFIASAHEDYWYLYIRLPEWKEMKMYPALIYSWDMDKIELAIENILQEFIDTYIDQVNPLFIELQRDLNKFTDQINQSVTDIANLASNITDSYDSAVAQYEAYLAQIKLDLTTNIEEAQLTE